jgi:hypothetical protein
VWSLKNANVHFLAERQKPAHTRAPHGTHLRFLSRPARNDGGFQAERGDARQGEQGSAATEAHEGGLGADRASHQERAAARKEELGVEESESEGEEEQENTLLANARSDLRLIAKKDVPLLAAYCMINHKTLKKPMGAPPKFAAAYNGFRPYFAGGYYITDVNQIPTRKKYLLFGLHLCDPRTKDPKFAEWCRQNNLAESEGDE